MRLVRWIRPVTDKKIERNEDNSTSNNGSIVSIGYRVVEALYKVMNAGGDVDWWVDYHIRDTTRLKI